LSILVSVAGINYYISYKLAFLNFYFIPILLGAYSLGVRKALLVAFLCALIVFVYAYLFPESFRPAFTYLDLWMNSVTWASFLILTAAIVGQLTTKLKTEVEQVTGLNQDL
jgi:adenylate cyclase